MTKNLLSSALFAGLIAGAVAALLQFVFVIPLLLEGELFEGGERLHFVIDGSPQSDRGSPGLGTEWGRHAMTVAFNLVTYTGYGLILGAIMSMAREMRGIALTAKSGIIWGLAGFVAVQLAPAVGLPPELPGTPAAELGPRQVWWVATILCTAVGLALIAFADKGIVQIVGGVLILLPHLFGAPHLDTYFGVAPPELSAEFAAISLGMAAIGWALLGYFTAYFLVRGEEA
ncbi:CbtA family protein [Cognatishimia maritima]|uniref:Cobalt transporter subunit CbtA n=1 Tax=Cognatishimia maritima TaxID=870908 RepID=A0A1M5ND23_9RHOB|nr:CbtA family protein [Cognatishimia maritima]SHG87516.1 cobalt transporter subunit CbtA [Cognatishimia maritima]